MENNKKSALGTSLNKSELNQYNEISIIDKFTFIQKFLIKLRKAIKLHYNDNEEIIARGMIGYFCDFTEGIIDICETYLVMSDRYSARLSGVDLVKSASSYGLMDKYLCNFIVKCVILRNRFTHDIKETPSHDIRRSKFEEPNQRFGFSLKRENAEQEIIKFCHSEVLYLDIFLESSNEVVKLGYRTIEH